MAIFSLSQSIDPDNFDPVNSDQMKRGDAEYCHARTVFMHVLYFCMHRTYACTIFMYKPSLCMYRIHGCTTFISEKSSIFYAAKPGWKKIGTY